MWAGRKHWNTTTGWAKNACPTAGRLRDSHSSLLSPLQPPPTCNPLHPATPSTLYSSRGRGANRTLLITLPPRPQVTSVPLEFCSPGKRNFDQNASFSFDWLVTATGPCRDIGEGRSWVHCGSADLGWVDSIRGYHNLCSGTVIMMLARAWNLFQFL